MRHLRIIKRNESQKTSSEKHWRIYALVFFIFFMSFAIIGKLSFLQILKHDQYSAQAENQHSKVSALAADRGEIFLKDENEPYPVAVNRELQMIYAVPREMKDREAAILQLSNILSIDLNLVKEKLKDPEDVFEILKHKLSENEVLKIKDAKISGVYLTPENFRYYPSTELAAQVIGFVGSNGTENRGMYGMEAYLENELRGENGSVKQEGDARGRWISVADRDVTKAKNGTDIVLTINHTVQYEVEKILREGLEQFAADSGTIVVSEPKTGKILAMANLPSFNPNDYSKIEDISVFNNTAINQPYESGSVFKTFTEAAGIDDGKINANSTYVDTGLINEAGFNIQNSDKKAYGVQTMTQVLEKSLNTGVIYIERLLGNAKFAQYVERFGFGEKTGIELPGEIAGSVQNLVNLNRDINFYTVAFGQGITVTPIQLAMAYGALANEGILMKPHIIEKKIFTDNTEEEIAPEEVRRVVSVQTAQEMGKMLRSVVLLGHGKRGDVPGYQIGGKTGTAQIPKLNGKGYEDGMSIGSFTGYGPINDPRFVVVVKLYNPKNVEWAESSAAPTFGRVMKFLLEYYKIKPTEDPATSPLAKMAPLALPNGTIAPDQSVPTLIAPNTNIENENKQKEQQKVKDKKK